PGHSGAAAAKHHRRVKAPASRYRLLHVVGIAGNHDSNRDLPVIAGGGGVHRAVGTVEADLPSQMAAQVSGESIGVDSGGNPGWTRGGEAFFNELIHTDYLTSLARKFRRSLNR